ncbi:MAG: HD domain-containing protein [Clostridia bacterium]
MDFEKLDMLARKLMSKRKAHLEREIGSIYGHGCRTAVGVQWLRAQIFPQQPEYDDLLHAAALFHDVGKGIEPHERYGAALVREALREMVTPLELEEIARLIFEHCARAPQSDRLDPWARLLQDADLLDHFGTYEIWMNFNFQAHHGASIDEACRFMQTEYDTYIAKHTALLNFPLSRAIMADKCAFMRTFAARLTIESTGAYVSENLPQA